LVRFFAGKEMNEKPPFKGLRPLFPTFNPSQSGLPRQKPFNGSEIKKDIFKTLKLGGLVQQTVQIVARFALTI